LVFHKISQTYEKELNNRINIYRLESNLGGFSIKKKQMMRNFTKNQDAVLGLPLRLTVSLIIGTVALLAILSHMMNPCLFPQKMIVSVTPMISTISGDNPQNVSFIVNVTDISGHRLLGASVIIKGLWGAGSGFSDNNGTALVQLQVQLDAGMHEGYLSVAVSAPCHESFEQEELIKIVRLGA
jgi:hypothetical protein